MIEQAINKLLIDEDEVSRRVKGRIFPQVASAKASFPYITFSRVTGTHYRHSSAITGLAMAVIQIDVWSDRYWAVKTIAEKIRLALDNFSGSVGSYTITGIFLESDQDLHTAPYGGDARGVHQESMDFNVWFTEATS